jgi:hypothetical protein
MGNSTTYHWRNPAAAVKKPLITQLTLHIDLSDRIFSSAWLRITAYSQA